MCARYYIGGNIITYILSMTCHETCLLTTSVRAGGLPLTRATDDDHQVSVNCTDTKYCQLEVTAPRLDMWHYLNVVNLHNSSIAVELQVNASGSLILFFYAVFVCQLIFYLNCNCDSTDFAMACLVDSSY